MLALPSGSLIRESDAILDYISTLEPSLIAEDAAKNYEIRGRLQSLPCSTAMPSSLMSALERELEARAHLAGDNFSIADAAALPFVQRIEATVRLCDPTVRRALWAR